MVVFNVEKNKDKATLHSDTMDLRVYSVPPVTQGLVAVVPGCGVLMPY